MRLLTPAGLAYPITVTKLLQKVDDEIEQSTPLFTYRYTARNIEYDEAKREDVERERSYFADFSSEVEGTIVSLNVRVNQVIFDRIAVAEIEEPCKHEVQFGGMCANCGKDMTSIQYNTTQLNTSRATINTVHGHTALLVSQAEASKADEEAKRRLLDARKLSLVVDLDQTIIQATVDPTVGEWQNDESNPNHEAVKDVRAFQLLDDGPGAKSCWYYIKLRPGLTRFLASVSQHYELHIYTMATRAYATNIAKIVDPDHKLFGDRILSRDENGSLSSKNLKRLFPVDTKMVVIIDDRGDVWSWSPNLVKVSAYDFFVGIGDINSSFLPKRPEIEARPTSAPKANAKADNQAAASARQDSNGTTAATADTKTASTNGERSAVDQMMSMAGGQDESSIKEKEDQADETIAAQLADRPLLQKQKILDAAEEEANASPAVDAAVELLAEDSEKQDATVNEHPRYRHNLLQDDDTELEYLGQSLRNIHKTYFDQYERDNVAFKGGRVAELRPEHGKKRPVDELERIPDAAEIMTGLKSKVLAGVSLVFSGVVPLGVDIQSHDIAIWAKTFGATVSENISKRTTHVIASPERRTAKVRQAAKRHGRIAIVNQNWLYGCFSQWERVSEEAYRIHSEAPPHGTQSALPDSFEAKEYALLSSSDDEAAQTEDEIDGTETDTLEGLGEQPSQTLELDTDTEELEQYKPSDGRDDSSPTEKEEAEDWGVINDELDEFLGSDDGASDSESVRSVSVAPGESEPGTPSSHRKRKLEAADGLADEPAAEGEASGLGSRLQKRKKEALERTSSLTSVASVPPVNGQVADNQAENTGVSDVDNEDGSDDDLEAQLAAELASD